jgi:hypothetical protein
VARALVFLAMFAVARAAAQPSAPSPIELEWSVPRGCPSAEHVRARVRKLAGPLPATGSPLRAVATIARKSDGVLHLRLVIRVDELVGERNIEGKSCEDLAGSAAIALALLLRSEEPLTEANRAAPTTRSNGSADDEARATRTDSDERSRADTPAREVAEPPSLQANEPHSSDGRSARRFHALLRVPLVAIGLGPLRQPSVAVALAAGASIERWRVLAEGKLWFPERLTMSSQNERYVATVDRYTAGLLGCRALFGPLFELAPCVSLSVEHLSARGTGPHIAQSEATATWLAAGIGAQARLRFTPWLGLLLGMEIQVQTARPKLAIEGVGQVEQLLPVAFSATFGSEWIL